MFTALAHARPRQLLVIADGPRDSAEAERCAQTRAIIDRVDWDCEVVTNYSDVNLGCKLRVASGLDWVFEKCEEAIVIEDDCLPEASFFPFCIELLERYRDDERVSMICGSNFQQGNRRSPASYLFLLHVTAWGWASWRRAWRHYDLEIKQWAELRETPWLENLLINPVAVKYWNETFDRTFAGEVDTWDYQFFFSWWARNALAIVPDRNLVTNIGFGSDSSHTADVLPTMANLPFETMNFPLQHPVEVSLNRRADDFSFRQICPWIVENQNLYWQFRHKLASSLPNPLRQKVRQLRARIKR